MQSFNSDDRQASAPESEPLTNAAPLGASEGPSVSSQEPQIPATSANVASDGFPHEGCKGSLQYRGFLDLLQAVTTVAAPLSRALNNLYRLPDPRLPAAPGSSEWYDQAVDGAAKLALDAMSRFSCAHEEALKRSSAYSRLMPFPSGLASRAHSEADCGWKVYHMVKNSKLLQGSHEKCGLCEDLEEGGDALTSLANTFQHSAETIMEGALASVRNTVGQAQRDLSWEKRSDLASAIRTEFSNRYQVAFASAWEELENGNTQAADKAQRATEAMNAYIGEGAAEKYEEWLDKLRSESGYSWDWCFELAEVGRRPSIASNYPS